MTSESTQDEMSASSKLFSEEMDFEEIFSSISSSGGQKSDDIDLEGIDKWFQEASVFDKDITNRDTYLAFSKIANEKQRINKEEFREMLNTLASEKNKDFSELETKLKSAGREVSEAIKEAKKSIEEHGRGSGPSRQVPKKSGFQQYSSDADSWP